MPTRNARRAQRHASRPPYDPGPLRVAVGHGPPVVTDPGAKVPSSRHERMAAGADQLAVLARARAAARRVTAGA